MRIREHLAGPAGYAFVAAIILLYLFVSLKPFHWQPPWKVINGAMRTQDELRFVTPGLVRSSGPAKWLSDAVRNNGFNLRLRVATASTDQFGPARIFTVSLDPHHRNLTVGQKGTNLVLRLRTASTTDNGLPEYIVPNVFVDAQWHAIELRVRDQQLTLFTDGKLALQERLPAAPMENWDLSYPVALGNELTGDRPWLGKVMRAEIEVEGQLLEHLDDQGLELPATYWPIPDWKSMLIVPFLGGGRRWTLDAVLNFACFISLGFALVFIRPTRGSFWRIVGTVALLSLVVELVQFGFDERYPSALDWVLNTAGAAVGVGCSKVFLGDRRPRESK